MYQVIEQTDDEKRKMYDKIPKSQIIDMLIECNKHIEMLTPRADFVTRLDFPRDSGGNILIKTATKFTTEFIWGNAPQGEAFWTAGDSQTAKT